eukprot:scaffold13862_cov200-Alexandrium_tamarense.AAC.3
MATLVLMWPSDVDRSVDEAYVTNHDAYAIVGWIDEQPLGNNEDAGDTSCAHQHFSASITEIVIGTVPLQATSVGDATYKEGKATESLLSNAIELLSKQNPCINPNSFGKSCGVCTRCATHQTLKVLSIVSSTPNESDVYNSSSDDKRRQIILYNKAEAHNWYNRHQMQTNNAYSAGSWQRTMLRVGESLNVWEELTHALEGDNPSDEEKERSLQHEQNHCDNCNQFGGFANQNNELNEAITVKHHSELLSESLLLTHWRTTATNGETQQCSWRCSKCDSIGLNNRSWANEIAERIPISSFLHQRQSGTYFTGVVIDSTLGIAIGLVLICQPLLIIKYIVSIWVRCHDLTLSSGLNWLESYPAGFKLNVALTQQMGREVRLTLQCHRMITSYVFTLISPVAAAQVVGVFAIVFGSRSFFALGFDISRIALIHTQIASSVFAACLRFELSTLSSLWLLFRGKKKNILRLRSDHLQYDHMQLLLGMVLFSVCVFLFTTILVYHWFFTVMSYASEIVVCGSWWIGFMIIDSILNIDRIIAETNAGSKNDKFWIGMEAQLHPVPLPNDVLLKSFVGSNKQSEDTQQPKALHGIVSVRSAAMSSMKLVFPITSKSSLVLKKTLSFMVSKVTRVSSFIMRLFLGSPCPVVSSCVDITRESRGRLKVSH